MRINHNLELWIHFNPTKFFGRLHFDPTSKKNTCCEKIFLICYKASTPAGARWSTESIEITPKRHATLFMQCECVEHEDNIKVTWFSIFKTLLLKIFLWTCVGRHVDMLLNIWNFSSADLQQVAQIFWEKKGWLMGRDFWSPLGFKSLIF